MDRDIEEGLYRVLDNALKNRKIIKELIKFAKEEFFLDLSNISPDELYHYWEQGGQSYTFKVKKTKLKKLEERYFWSAFMYKLVKNNFKLKKFEDLVFFEINNDYYFFDPDIEDYVGFISCGKLKDSSQTTNAIKKSALCVNTSAVDKAFQGSGYGKKMYLAIINDAGCLLSDTSLYDSSLNIWANVLPKYIKYVGYVDESDNLRKISGRMDTKAGGIKRFFATNDPSFLKRPILK
jgi:ribosomal protein S18 acetylase RimI-like enzyme